LADRYGATTSAPFARALTRPIFSKETTVKLGAKALIRGAGLAAVGAVMATVAHAIDISGAGASFPFPIYAKWAEAYKQKTGNGLNYQSIGSGGGIKQIKEKTVTFGATDMPLKAEDLDAAGLVQFPMVMGGVVPVINVKGIAPGQLVLDGPTIAAMYMGDIKKWDDAAIKKLNPGVTLPSTAIAPAYRSDGSGTNFLFTDYLAKTSEKFKSAVGVNTSVQWPIGIGAKGNEGVANTVKQTDGAIGYVEYAYAKQNKMSHANMINKVGKNVAPDADTFQAAAASADWAGTKGYGVILTNQAGDKSWPITGASFILMHKQAQNAEASAEALKFFSWAYANGGKMADDLDYVAMPGNVATMVQKTWAAEIKGPNGPLWKMAAN
jgi:phosphate transport system substrate-binding protein